MSEKCVGLLGRLFGHKFRPRFNERDLLPDSVAQSLQVTFQEYVQSSKMLLEGNDHAFERNLRAFHSTHSVYVCDVCARCGKPAPDPFHQKHEDT